VFRFTVYDDVISLCNVLLVLNTTSHIHSLTFSVIISGLNLFIL